MTESTIFALYGVFMLAIVLAWRSGRTGHFILGGALLGLLCLAKPSYLVLLPIVAALSFVYLYWLAEPRRPHALGRVLAFCLAFGCVAGAWVARNAVSVGKLGFTEEYGAVVLIERFAYNDMTLREFFQAFPYCTPGLGEIAFDPVYGTDSMHRFTYHTAGSFFHVGRDRRDTLVAQYGRVGPADFRHHPRRDAQRLVAPSAGQHSAGMVRAVGRLARKPCPGAVVRLGLCPRRAHAAAAAAVLCGAGRGHARPRCPDRQPLHAVQSHSDRAVRGRRRLDHDVVAAEAGRALAMAISRVSAVISSICERSFRCRFSITIRLMITQT